MTILVTGAAGFIGMHVADRLMAQGHAVVGIDNLNDYYPVSLKQARLDSLRAAHGKLFTFHQLDFADMDALNATLHDQVIESIVHLGAQAGVRYSLVNPHAYVRSGGCGIWSMRPLPRSMAAMTRCPSVLRIAPIIPYRSMPLPSAPMN